MKAHRTKHAFDGSGTIFEEPENRLINEERSELGGSTSVNDYI
jgi:hypothetical protein